MDTVMMIAGITALLAVSLLFFSMFVAGETGAARLEAGPGLFKTGNPTLEGKASTQGLQKGHVDLPATLEGDRHHVREPRARE